MANIPTIHLAPPVVTEIAGVAITNTLVATVLTSVILLVLAFLVKRKAGLVPSRAQVAFEMILEFMTEKMVIAFGSEEEARKFFPLIFTIFLFLLVANQFTLIPFVESLVVRAADGEGVNLLRTPSSDYSLPIILAVLVWLTANGLALLKSPLRYIGNFIKIDVFFKMKSIKDLPMAFLDFFLGLLDIIGEIAKLVSLSTRLFGNIFAGEVIIAIISGLLFATQFLVPIPFLGLSILSGFVQAFVFAMLSTIYISSSLAVVKKQNS